VIASQISRAEGDAASFVYKFYLPRPLIGVKVRRKDVWSREIVAANEDVRLF
jgi:hypothetical protein